MESRTNLPELLAFVKALSDANRLKILGLLSQEPLTVEQLSALLDLRPSTVSHHLAKLSGAGLVGARVDGHYHIYELDAGALEDTARRLFSRDNLPAIAADIDMDAYDRKVVRDFSTPDGRLRSIPAQYKKTKAILRHVVGAFDAGSRYTEQEVNEILAGFHEDTARLRRELVESGLMSRERDGRAYWRAYWRTDGRADDTR